MRRRTLVAAAVLGAAVGGLLLWWAIPTTGSRLDEARELALEGRQPEAVAAYRAILATLDPTDPDVRGDRAEALARLGDLLYLHLGDPVAAADAYRRLILEAPGREEAWSAREKLADIARRHLGDLHEAIAHEQALGASGRPGADRFAYRAAKGYLELRDTEQCRREARALVEAHPEAEWTDDALLLFATCHAVDGAHEEAIAAYREVIARFPGTETAARALYWIAGEQAALGDLEAALATYLEVLPVHPDPARVQPDVERMRKLIAEKRAADEGIREAHLQR